MTARARISDDLLDRLEKRAKESGLIYRVSRNGLTVEIVPPAPKQDDYETVDLKR